MPSIFYHKIFIFNTLKSNFNSTVRNIFNNIINNVYLTKIIVRIIKIFNFIKFRPLNIKFTFKDVIYQKIYNKKIHI